jgi:hypothetical protein
VVFERQRFLDFFAADLFVVFFLAVLFLVTAFLVETFFPTAFFVVVFFFATFFAVAFLVGVLFAAFGDVLFEEDFFAADFLAGFFFATLFTGVFPGEGGFGGVFWATGVVVEAGADPPGSQKLSSCNLSLWNHEACHDFGSFMELMTFLPLECMTAASARNS